MEARSTVSLIYNFIFLYNCVVICYCSLIIADVVPTITAVSDVTFYIEVAGEGPFLTSGASL